MNFKGLKVDMRSHVVLFGANSPLLTPTKGILFFFDYKSRTRLIISFFSIEITLYSYFSVEASLSATPVLYFKLSNSNNFEL